MDNIGTPPTEPVDNLLTDAPGLNDTLAQAVIACAPDGILLLDAQGTILLANTMMQSLSGYAQAEMLGQGIALFMPPEQHEAHRAHLRDFAQHPVARPMALVGNLALRHKDGHMVAVDVATSPCVSAGNASTVVFVRDLTEMKRLESQMQYHATHDALTGLVNRWLFNEYLTQALARTDRAHTQLGLLLLDLDGFKAINDIHGHAIGDKALQEVARRLSSVIRAGDILARLGGDEFTVLLQQLGNASELSAVADKLVDVLALPCVIDGHLVHIGASVGWALCPNDSNDAELLMRCADAAMYMAKRSGGGRSASFGERLYQRHAGRGPDTMT